MEAFIKDLFVDVVNMSITSAYVLVFVLFVRLLLRKAPKLFSYSLWGVVLFRMICPFSFTSAFSIFKTVEKGPVRIPHTPISGVIAEQIPFGTDMSITPSEINTSVPPSMITSTTEHADWMLLLLAIIWSAGVAALVIYSLISYFKLKHKVLTAVQLKANVFECDSISSPFVLGIIKPKIYLPIGLAECGKDYILKHEQTHIRRLDHVIKPIAFLASCVHWFNPLAWIGFKLMTKDMEMSCDERVLKEIGAEVKKEYSTTLLSLAAKPGIINAIPFASGESNVKARIKNVLNYRKPAFWVILAAACTALVSGFLLLANPAAQEQDLSFLNVDNAVTLSAQTKTLILRSKTGGVPVSGNEFGKWLDISSNDWKRLDSPSIQPGEPSYTIYINNSTGYKISFYEQNKTLATISFRNEISYYEIPEEHSQWIGFRYAIVSYNIPREVLAAILDGKESKRKSVQDVPDVKFQILRVGEENYYLYEDKGKFYVEQPYQSIMEISEEIYRNALPFSTEYSEDMGLPQKTEVIPETPAWSTEQSLGVDMVSIDYASDDIVIFHGYFGLFVYDLNRLQIVRSLDLSAIGCDATQGDNYCEVSVSKDGSIIQLHPISSNNMYVYAVPDNSLSEVPYKKMEDQFNQFVNINEALKTDEVNYSYHAVKFGENEYGIIHASDWKLGGLYYIRGDVSYRLFQPTIEDAINIDDKLTPDLIKRLYDSKSPNYMEYICKSLGIAEWYGREPDRLEIKEMALSESEPYTVVEIYNPFDLKMLVFKKNKDLSFGFVGEIVLGGRAAGTEYQLENYGNRIWLVGNKCRGYGTGIAIYHKEWYEVSDNGIRCVLSYPYDAHDYGPYGGYSVIADNITEAGSNGFNIDYRITRRYNLTLDGIIREFDIEGSLPAQFVWDEKNEKFIFDFDTDESGAVQIPFVTPEITGQCDKLLPEYYEKLSESIRNLSADDEGMTWRAGGIKAFLNECSDCAQKTELLNELSKVYPEI